MDRSTAESVRFRFVRETPLVVVALALLSVALHVAVSGNYGFHRDELYYVAGGLRYELGYVDHPPLAPWVAGWTTQLFGLNLRVLRLWAAVGGGVSVLLAAGFCRALGGGVRGQRLAALATILCPLFFFTHTVYQTNLFDQLAWNTALLVLVIGLLRAGKRRVAIGYWVGFGVVVAVGALAKYTIGVLGVGLVLGLLLARRREFANPGLYLGGGIAMLGFAPSLWWQLRHGFPFREFASNREHFPLWAFVAMLAGMIGLGALPFVWAGLKVLFSEKVRVIGWTTLAVLMTFMVLGSKPYYPNPLFVLLFGAGAVALEHTRSRWPEWLLLVNLGVLPMLMPILPLSLFARIPDPIGEVSETVGWEELVDQVQDVYGKLLPEHQEGLVIITANYGEAGALELLWSGPDRPPVVCGQNSYAFWMAEALGERSIDRAIVLGYSRRWVLEQFSTVREIGQITNRFGVENEELGGSVFFASDLQISLAALLERLTHHG